MHYIQENRTEDLADIHSDIDDEDFKEVFRRSISIMSATKDDRPLVLKFLSWLFLYKKYLFHRSQNGSIRTVESRRTSRQSEQGEEKPQSKGKLIATEDSAIGAVSWTVYLRYFKSVGYIFVFLIFFKNILAQIASIGSNSKFY